MRRTPKPRPPIPRPRPGGSLRVSRQRGFTLVELLIVVTVLAVVLTLAVPGLFAYNERRRLEGTAEQAAVLLRKARYDAIRRSRQVTVALDSTAGAVFLDRDGDRTLDPEEVRAGVVRLPRGVLPGGPAADDPAVVGFTLEGGARVAVFAPDGSLRGDGGAFRLRDDQRNFLEVRVIDPATASVVLRKWEDGTWRRKGEGGRSWHWDS